VDFWGSTLQSVYNIIEGRSEAENDKEKSEWERVRWLAMAMMQPHLQKGKRLAPQDLVTFHWEQEQTEQPPQDEAAAQKRAEKIAKWDANIKKRHGSNNQTDG
jgi:hypothetical protein